MSASDAAERRLPGTGSRAVQQATDVERYDLSAGWAFDTTDDPLFPTHGDELTASLVYTDFASDFASDPAAVVDLARMRSQQLSAGDRRPAQLVGQPPANRVRRLQAACRPLAGRGRAGACGRHGGGLGVVEPSELQVLRRDDVTTWEVGAEFRYSLRLAERRARRLGEMRWETAARVFYIETTPAFDSAASPLRGLSFESTVALRNDWGVFRVGFTVLDIG